MSRVEIVVNGKAYPCYTTAGAMLRFKDLTGKEVSEIGAKDTSLHIKYLWCCVVAASKREGKEFSIPLMDFADCMTDEEIAKWQSMQPPAGEQADSGKKNE